MKGLEASIVKFSELPVDNPKLRLDSQFQARAALEAIETIRERNHVTIAALTEKPLKGRNIPYTEEGLFPVVRSGDVSQFFDPDTLLRSSSLDDAFFLKENDILISSIGQGSIGKVQLFRQPGSYATVSEVTVVRLKANSYSPAFVAAFLSSVYGQAQIQRFITGATGQLHLYPSDVARIVVPELSAAFQSRLSAIFDQGWLSYLSSRTAQKKAEDTLFTALGLAGWKPPEPLAYTARASDAFAAERIDAQYFRPIFYEIERHLRVTGRAVELGAILSTNSRGRQPKYDDAGLPVINSKHVRTNRVVLNNTRVANEVDAPVIIEKGDVLLNGTGVGTIGRAAPYLYDQQALPDNHVTVLRTTQVDPVYLAVFLNSPLGQWQIERHTRGSSGQVELYPADISKIVFWDAPGDIQSRVRDAILFSFKDERRAQDFLEACNRAVEIAIDDGEDAAMVFLDQAEEKH
ncbi:MAG: hypothetical protein AB7D06_16575 [Pedobacter sp.]